MVLRSTALLFVIFVSCNAFFFTGPDWSDLKVTWGLNPFSSHTFDTLPRSTADAISEGFVKVSDCDASKPWRGSRYVKDNDFAVILLFDVNGYIAGIQTGIPKGQPDGYPSAFLRPPFVDDVTRWVISAYFVDPAIICTTGRTAEEFESQGTGTGVYIQNSTVPENSLLVPMHESDLAGTRWTEGKCFYTMGKHYWYNLREDIPCDRLFPVFLMYNGGELNSFGWAFLTSLDSPRFEHPKPSDASRFMQTVPTCLTQFEELTTMHIYFDSPMTNFC